MWPLGWKVWGTKMAKYLWQPRLRMVVDLFMTVGLLALMAYERIGQAAHEWVGTGMLVLFVAHHILNCRWWAALTKGRWTAFRALQTMFVLLVLVTMIGQMASGIWLSREVFAFLPLSGGQSLARTVHLLAAYWGFVALGLHLGLHWGGVIAAVRRAAHRQPPARSSQWALKTLGILVAVYGAVAFVRRGLPDYLFYRTQFGFFDYEEPLVFFFADYIAILALFVLTGYWLARLSQIVGKTKKM